MRMFGDSALLNRARLMLKDRRIELVPMKRVRHLLVVVSMVMATLIAAIPASAAAIAARCVGSAPGCVATIQQALDAAHDGDVIRIGRGTFAGGITVTKSVTLIGAGARATILQGGGPVLTIGGFLAAGSPLDVTLAGMTVTGGVTTSSPQSQLWAGADNVIAAGGGIVVNPTADYGPGANLMIKDSVVTRNVAAPSATVSSVVVPCPGGPCSFASANGGGIDTWGNLTLVNSVVSHNVAAGVASDADGGGIHNWQGDVTLRDSTVTDNQAIVTAPNGRFAEGGGIFTNGGAAVTLQGSAVSNNLASLTSQLPYFVGDTAGDTIDMNANGGGVHVGGGSTVTIDHSALNGNSVAVDDANGEPAGFDAAILPHDSTLVIRDSSIANNHVVANVASSQDVGPSGTAFDIQGPATVSNTSVTGNTTVVTSSAGPAWAAAAIYVCGTPCWSGPTPPQAVIKNSVISDNIVTARNPSGEASVFGAGIANDYQVELRNVRVSDNVAVGSGMSGVVQGGGVRNATLFNAGPSLLTLVGSTITHNKLVGATGNTLQGAGLYTDFPITMRTTSIRNNTPDDCFGCVPPAPHLTGSTVVPTAAKSARHESHETSHG